MTTKAGRNASSLFIPTAPVSKARNSCARLCQLMQLPVSKNRYAEGRITITQRDRSTALDNWPLGQELTPLFLDRNFVTPE
jgi:hypothetical protein